MELVKGDEHTSLPYLGLNEVGRKFYGRRPGVLKRSLATNQNGRHGQLNPYLLMPQPNAINL